MRNLTSPPSILPRLNSDPRIYRIRWIALVLGLAWLMGPRATTVEAQTSEDYLDAIGIPAFTTAQPVEKGFINLSNGNLHLNLPLTSLPQRAGSQATVSLMYDSRIWSWSGILGWGGEWVANPAYVVPSAGGWMGGWRLVSTAYPGGVAPLGDEDEQYCPSTDSYDGDKIGPFGWAEPDGTQHNFRIFVHETFENWCGGLHHSAVPASAGDAFADDASGFHMYLAAAPNVYTQGTITVYGPDGTKVYDDTSGTALGPKDANGNYYSTDANGNPVDFLGRTLVTTAINGNTITYTVLNSQNGSSVYTVTKRTINVYFNGVPSAPSTLTVIDSISLPDGTSYSFTYDEGSTGYHPGTLTSMTLPTGGTINYSYSDFTDLSCNSSRWITGRTTSDGTWAYTPQLTNPQCSYYLNHIYQVSVMKPSGDASVYQFDLQFGARPVQADYYTGGVTSGNLLASVTQTYDSSHGCEDGSVCDIVKLTDTTTLPIPGGTSLKTTHRYTWDNSGAYGQSQYGNITKTEEWKFYSGSLPTSPDRTTDITYLNSSSYLNKNIVNRRASITVSDGSGTVAKTLNAYDSSSPVSATGMSKHDDAFGTSYTYRGNLTQVQRLVSGTSSYLTKSMTYDMTGQLRTETDWMNNTGNPTTYSYTNNFYYDGGDSSNPIPYSPASTNAYLTTITSPVVSGSSLVTTFGYYWGTGQKALTTDPNNQTTYFHYHDSMNRPTSTKLPISSPSCCGWNYWTYPSNSETQVDKGIGITSASRSTNCTGTGDCRHDQSQLDGLSRIIHNTLVSDPDGQTTVDTTYDSSGRIYSLSNPHRSGSSPTDGAQTFAYDGLDRKTIVTQPDGTATVKLYGAAVTAAGGLGTQQGSTSTYGRGYPVLLIDEAAKMRQLWIDGFGRTIEVDEPAVATTSGTSGSGSMSVGIPATGSVTISGSEQSIWTCDEFGSCWTEYDYGGVSITVNGSMISAGYDNYSSSSSIAAALVSAINGSGTYPATATLSGTTINLTAKQTGTQGNYSLSTAQVTSDPQFFASSSYTATRSGPTLTGGSNTGTVTSAGSVWVTVNGFQASANYSSGSTPSSVANAVASALNASGNSPVTASCSGNTVTLTAKAVGAVTNYSLTSGPSSGSSLTASTSGSALTGGANAGSFSSPLVTLYTYDSNNNLTGVVQAAETRSYAYDKLSRVTAATDPESGITNYYYTTSGGALCSGDIKAVCRKSDARSITTTSTYDAMNQVTQRSYSDSTATVNYYYGQTSYNGLTITNGKGRRTGMSDGSGQAAWSYDAAGNIRYEMRTIGTVTKTIQYTYNLDSSVATVQYPSGRTVTYQPGDAQRPLSAVDSGSSINYATSAHYAPQGALASLQNGSSLVSTLYYDKRLQPCRISVKSSGNVPSNCADVGTNTGNVFDLSYNFSLGTSDNGNVAGITNNRDTTRSQTFTYDTLNRINTAVASTYATSHANCWGEAFTYDRWGNLLSISAASSAYNGCTNTENLAVSVSSTTPNNRLVGYCYDSAGNMLGISPSCTTYSYNAENQLTSTAGVTYTYDGDGKRVKKSTGTLYWYDSGNNPLAETDASGNTTSEFVFFGGKRIARRDSSANVYYYFADHVGSSSVVTNASGGVLDDSNFYPFGGERSVSSSSGNHYKFTGKERDGESNLDYFIARHYSSAWGRFLQADNFPGGIVDPYSGQQVEQPGPLPYADLNDPQTLNKYTYVRDNPLRYIDPDGHQDCDGNTPCPQKAPAKSEAQRQNQDQNAGQSQKTQSTFSKVVNRFVAAATGVANVMSGTEKVGAGAATAAAAPATGPGVAAAGAAATYAIYNGTGQVTAGIKSVQYAITGNEEYEQASDKIIASTTIAGAIVYSATGSVSAGAAAGSIENGVPSFLGPGRAAEATAALVEWANRLRGSGPNAQ